MALLQDIGSFNQPRYIGSLFNLHNILSQIASDLELAKTERGNVEDRYAALVVFLNESEAFRGFKVKIIPIGSLPLGTTTRPVLKDEFDLDAMVLIYDGERPLSPNAAYEMLLAALESSKVYKARRKKKSRCIQLKYHGKLHVDLMPAVPDPWKGEGFFLVPDKKLKGYVSSAPTKFTEYFIDQCKVESIRNMTRDSVNAEPIPAPEEPDEKAILKKVVQLIKRHRDLYFKGDKKSVPSIVITALAAQFYRGESSLFDALTNIARQIYRLAAQHSEPFDLFNPRNPDETYTNKWYELAERFIAFRQWSHKLLFQVHGLEEKEGYAEILDHLEAMFGEKPAKNSFNKIANRLNEERSNGRLNLVSTGLIVGATNGHGAKSVPVRSNTFYGD